MLGRCNQGPEFGDAGEGGLVLGVVCRMDVAKFVVEGCLHVVDGIIIGDGVGSNMIPSCAGGSRS